MVERPGVTVVLRHTDGTGLGLDTFTVTDVQRDGAQANVRLELSPLIVGPPGILQGGFVSSVLIAAARAAADTDAPVTTSDVRLAKPTPVGETVTATVHRQSALKHMVSLQDDYGAETASGTVELGGPEPVTVAADLREPADVALPEVFAQQYFPTCVVCGPQAELGLRSLPALLSDDRAVHEWLPSAQHTVDDHLDSQWVAPILDCPAVWAAWRPITQTETDAGPGVGALLANMRTQFLQPAPAHEILRAVAVTDRVDGRKVYSRTALVDTDGVAYATASLLSIIVGTIPSLEVQ